MGHTVWKAWKRAQKLSTLHVPVRTICTFDSAGCAAWTLPSAAKDFCTFRESLLTSSPLFAARVTKFNSPLSEGMSVRLTEHNEVSFFRWQSLWHAAAFSQKLNLISESQYVKQRLPFSPFFVELAACKVIRMGLLWAVNPSYVGHMAQLSSHSFVNYSTASSRCCHSFMQGPSTSHSWVNLYIVEAA